MALKHLVDIDLSGNEIQNVVLQNLATAPTGVEGQIYYDTASNSVKVHTGSGFVRVGFSVDGTTITESSGVISVGSIAISNVTNLQTSLDGKVDDSQVLTDVPANAVFTDTTYTVGNGGLTEINFTSALNTKLAGIATGADVTPSWVPSTDPNYATETYVDTAVANVVASAPAALDTLNELAAALNDDANFSTTVTNAIAAKLDSSAYTAADVLTKIKTVDGAGSGLDADLLDGNSSAHYLNYNNLNNTPNLTAVPSYVTKTVSGAGATTSLGLGFGGWANIQIYLDGDLVITEISQDGSGGATANLPTGDDYRIVAVGQ